MSTLLGRVGRGAGARRGDRPLLLRATRGLRGSSLVVATGMACAHLLGYAYNLAMSRALGPVGYGEVAALLGIVTVGSVPATALGVVVARRTAALRTAGAPGTALATFLPSAVRLGLASGAIVALATVPLTHLFKLTSPTHALLAAATLAPFAVTCAVEGSLQGAQRYARLAMVFAWTGVARFLGGLAGLAVGRTTTAVLVGTALAAVLSAAASVLVVDGRRGSHDRELMTGFALELWHVVVAVGGLLALSNLDLLLARAYLPAQAAGLYAAGSLATKAVYWAPQFVAVTVFPRLTDPVARRRLMPVAVAVVAGIGLSATVLAALLGGRLIELLVGPAYTSLGNTLWAFCLLGGLLAVAQLFVSAALAVRDRTVARLVWAACVLEVALVGGLLHRSVFQVVGAATLSAAALVVACAMGYRRASTAAGGAVSAAAPRPA